jgi:hypothetical protein
VYLVLASGLRVRRIKKYGKKTWAVVATTLQKGSDEL